MFSRLHAVICSAIDWSCGFTLDSTADKDVRLKVKQILEAK